MRTHPNTSARVHAPGCTRSDAEGQRNDQPERDPLGDRVPHFAAQRVWPAAVRLHHVPMAALQVRWPAAVCLPCAHPAFVRVHWPAAVRIIMFLWLPFRCVGVGVGVKVPCWVQEADVHQALVHHSVPLLFPLSSLPCPTVSSVPSWWPDSHPLTGGHALMVLHSVLPAVPQRIAPPWRMRGRLAKEWRVKCGTMTCRPMNGLLPIH